MQSALASYLTRLSTDRITDVSAGGPLDAEILALLVEESLSEVTDEWIESLLSDTLAFTQSSNEEVRSRLRLGLKRASSRILESVPDADTRKAFGLTGLMLTTCRSFEEHVGNHKDELSGLLCDESGRSRAVLTRLILSACLSSEQLQPPRPFAGSYAELLELWMSGAEISGLRAFFEEHSDSSEDLGKIVAQWFGYLLPWGMAGYVQIAKHVLGLSDDQLSTDSRMLPSMVRYGVASSEDVWAMSLGVPSRRLAIAMSSRFASVLPGGDLRSFLTWLGELRAEDVSDTFGLRTPLLEEVALLLSRISPSPLLRSYQGIEAILPVDITLAPHPGSKVASSARALVGGSVDLVRDFDNYLDRNAVTASQNGQILGQVPKRLSQLLGPELDAGRSFSARVTKAAHVDDASVGISIASSSSSSI